ncbi:MAG: hypothetical protein HY264_07380 [Chloroflexi bacterium]|nr:hypothetical protein [Chloroflexota bacterium]
MTHPGDGVEPLLGARALGDAPDRLALAAGPHQIVSGWATVELDRAEEEVAGLLGLDEPVRASAVDDDRVLGARCRLLQAGTTSVLLMEPSTEGRLAAALARRGEGFTVRYLLVDGGAPERARRAGFMLTSAGRGPFGGERLVVDGPRSGPFLVLAGLD